MVNWRKINNLNYFNVPLLGSMTEMKSLSEVESGNFFCKQCLCTHEYW